MTRDMFLKELRIALQGKISQAEVNENLAYYENYIIEESRKGRTEEQVLEDLGNPRLLAKTIIETSKSRIYGEEQKYDYEEGRKEYFGKKKGFHIHFNEKDGWDIRYGRFKINSWYGYTCIAIILIIILALIAQVAIAVIPILIPLLLLGTILYFLFYGNRK